MAWLRAHRYWLSRRATQIGILVLFWLGAHAHVGVLTGNLSSSRIFRTIPLSDPYAVVQILATGQTVAATALLGALIVVAFYWIVGGRAFCGWVCPVNLLADASRWARRRYHLHGQFRISRAVRFWILGLSLPVAAVTGVAAFEWLSPIGMIQREIIFGPGLGLLAILAIVLVDLFAARDGWCGTLCPLGAFYSLVGRASPLRVGFAPERCDHCNECISVCPEPHVIDFAEMSQRGLIGSGDCLNCARCLEVCPRDAYHFTLRGTSSAATDSKGGDHNATNLAA